jgi:hypothetical protein
MLKKIMKNPKHTLILLITGFILLAALSRLLPHPPNFTPVIAIALFAGAYFRNSLWAWVLPLCVMMVSDLGLWWLHGYDLFTLMRLVIYLSLLAIVGIGIPVGRKISVSGVLGGSLAGAILFFVVTNFAVWLGGRLYPMTWEGLMACYTAAIPFFRNTLMSTLLYSALMFGAIEWAKAWWSLPARPVSVS